MVTTTQTAKGRKKKGVTTILDDYTSLGWSIITVIEKKPIKRLKVKKRKRNDEKRAID